MSSLSGGRSNRCDDPFACDTRETVTGPPPQTHDERYRLLMKKPRVISPLLMSLLLGSVALAQDGTSAVPDTPQPQNSVASPSEVSSITRMEASGEGKLLSQARRDPRFRHRQARPTHGRAYLSDFSSPPGLSPIGALIGFGAGAVLGASNPQANTVRAHVALGLIGGSIGAFIGGVIGGAFPHVRRGYPPPDDDDDEEGNFRSDGSGVDSGRSVRARSVASGHSARVGATARLSETPAGP